MTARSSVLLLGLNFPPEPTGIAPYSGGFATGLCKLGHAVAVRVAHPHYPYWRISEGFGQWTLDTEDSGVKIKRLRHYVPQRPRGVARLISEVSFGLRLLGVGWGRPDVVVAVSPALFATAVAVIRRRLSTRRPPLIVWVQDIYTVGLEETGEGSALVRRITRWVETFVLRSADRVVVIHPRFADTVTREFGVDSSRVSVIRNWTHLPRTANLAAAEDIRRELGCPDGAILVVHAGSMGAKQGLDNIVEAAREADRREAPVHFALIGSGGQRSELEALARGVNRISFVDTMNDDRYRAALCAADVLVLNEKPGVGSMAVPSKLTSYFDAGRPVIAATDPGGIAAEEIRAAQAGVVVRAGYPGELLSAVLGIGANGPVGARYGENGRRYRESILGEHTAIALWDSLIEDVVAGGAGTNRWRSRNRLGRMTAGEGVKLTLVRSRGGDTTPSSL